MEVLVMQINFFVSKEERKLLVQAVSEIIGCELIYKKAPGFEYVVTNYTIDRHGSLIYDERVSEEEAQHLLSELAARGFAHEAIADSAATAPDRLVVEVPLDGFTDSALNNLERLVAGKAALIMKAIGASALPVERTETSARFPWFSAAASYAEIDAYTRFIHALCDMAKKQKRVIMKEKSSDGNSSDKFAMRCFLLRLGFIGAEYKAARTVMLSKLSGNGSFKHGDHKNKPRLKAFDSRIKWDKNSTLKRLEFHLFKR